MRAHFGYRNDLHGIPVGFWIMFGVTATGERFTPWKYKLWVGGYWYPWWGWWRVMSRSWRDHLPHFEWLSA